MFDLNKTNKNTTAQQKLREQLNALRSKAEDKPKTQHIEGVDKTTLDRAAKPPEVQLSHDLSEARAQYKAATSEADKKAAMTRISDLEMRLAMEKEKSAKS